MRPVACYRVITWKRSRSNTSRSSTSRFMSKCLRLQVFFSRASQRLVETADKALFAEGLAKIAKGASRQRAQARWLFGKCRNKNCGHLNAAGDQPPLEVDSA